MVKFSRVFEEKLKKVDESIVKAIRENAKLQKFNDYYDIEELSEAFLWSNSNEGYKFWENVERKYNI